MTPFPLALPNNVEHQTDDNESEEEDEVATPKASEAPVVKEEDIKIVFDPEVEDTAGNRDNSASIF